MGRKFLRIPFELIAVFFVSVSLLGCSGLAVSKQPLACETTHVQIVGMEKQKALVLIKESGFRPRILIEDGQSFVGTQDYREDRINLFIEDGKVLGIAVAVLAIASTGAIAAQPYTPKDQIADSII
eukprot:gene14739-19495_t